MAYYLLVEAPEAGHHSVVGRKVPYHTADPGEHSPDEDSRPPLGLAVNYHLHKKDDKELGYHILLHCIQDHVHSSVELGRNMEELLAVAVRNCSCNSPVKRAEDPWEQGKGHDHDLIPGHHPYDHRNSHTHHHHPVPAAALLMEDVFAPILNQSCRSLKSPFAEADNYYHHMLEGAEHTVNAEMEEDMILVADNCTHLTVKDEEDLGGDPIGAVQVRVDETPAVAADYNRQIERTTLPSDS